MGADVIKVNGAYYLPYAPLNALIMAIPYFFENKLMYFSTRFFILDKNSIDIFDSLALSFVSSLCLAIIAFALFKYGKNLKINSNYLIFTVFGITLGTILFTYSVSFFNHIISAVFIFLAFLTLQKQSFHVETSQFSIFSHRYNFITFNFITNISLRITPHLPYLISGLFCSLAFLTEHPVIFFSIAIFIRELFLLKDKKTTLKTSFLNLVTFATPVAICIIGMFIFNQYHFGTFYKFSDTIFQEIRYEKYGTSFGFNQNLFFGIYGMYLSPMKGLFVYSPFLLFSFFGIKKFYKADKYNFILASGYIFVITILYALWTDCFGATTFGTRYMVTLIPFFANFLMYGLNTIFKNKFLKFVFIIFIIISIVNIVLNTYTGLAGSKFGKCININSYNPYLRIKENYIDRSPRISPVIIKLADSLIH